MTDSKYPRRANAIGWIAIIANVALVLYYLVIYRTTWWHAAEFVPILCAVAWSLTGRLRDSARHIALALAFAATASITALVWLLEYYAYGQPEYGGLVDSFAVSLLLGALAISLFVDASRAVRLGAAAAASVSYALVMVTVIYVYRQLT